MKKIYKNAKYQIWEDIKSLKDLSRQGGFDKNVLEKMLWEKYDLLAFIAGKEDKKKFNY